METLAAEYGVMGGMIHAARYSQGSEARMFEEGLGLRTKGPGRIAVVSAAAHGVVLLGLLGVIHGTRVIAPYRLPGTAMGVRQLTYFSPDGSAKSASEAVVKALKAVMRADSRLAVKAPVEVAEAQATVGHSNTEGASGQGNGDISIALPQKFPWPRPALDTMARGSKGDVVLDATIDEQGKIANLVVTQSVNATVDEAVMAVVKEWVFTPAMKQGKAVASEQELRFHYERG